MNPKNPLDKHDQKNYNDHMENPAKEREFEDLPCDGDDIED